MQRTITLSLIQRRSGKVLAGAPITEVRFRWLPRGERSSVICGRVPCREAEMSDAFRVYS